MMLGVASGVKVLIQKRRRLRNLFAFIFVLALLLGALQLSEAVVHLDAQPLPYEVKELRVEVNDG